MYAYHDERPKLFTEDGSVQFTRIRDNVLRLLKEAGAVRSSEATRGVPGDSWIHLAALDRMVELGELRELTPPNTMGQYRVFTRPYTDSF